MAGLAITVEPIEPIPETSSAERVVADVLSIGASVVDAERVRDSVALWFHTFALAPGVYTPGIARDHGYRLVVLDADRFAGRSVLDVGAFAELAHVQRVHPAVLNPRSDQPSDRAEANAALKRHAEVPAASSLIRPMQSGI